MPRSIALGLVVAASSLLGCPPRPASHDGDAGADAQPRESVGPAPVEPKLVGLSAGKYGCTLSVYDARGGQYEFRPKGSIVLHDDGTYTYLGLATPSEGRFTVDARTGKISLAGGHLTGGELTPIEGRDHRFLIVAPAIDGRWKCGLGS